MNPDVDRGGHTRQETEDTIIENPRGSYFQVGTTIPETHEARTLVLCFDGTGDKFDDDNTNVVEFFRMLKKDDHQKQMVYYQAGIGTYISRKALPMGTKVSQILDEAIAWDLSSHIIEGYEYLMEHYQTGDNICIFGFSRGAYTAGGLASMICKVGLLPKSNRQQVRFAYNTFTSDCGRGSKRSKAFKDTFSINVSIKFIGVWDTVNSVGLIPQRVPFNTRCGTIQTFRHALALDERRVKFKATPWKMDKSHEFDDKTDAEQVWFAGCHCDVGGGSVENGRPHSLARIPLRWMIRECFKTNTGIMFESEKLRATGIDPSTLYPEVQERPLRLAASNQCIERAPSARERWNEHKKKKEEEKKEEMKRKAESKQKGKKKRNRNRKTDEEKKSNTNNDEKHGQAIDTKTKEGHKLCEPSETDIGLAVHAGKPHSAGVDLYSSYPDVQQRPSPHPVSGHHSGQVSSSVEGKESLSPKEDIKTCAQALDEEEHELRDVLSPIHDQLSLCPFWWLLEVFPVKRHKKENDSCWNIRYRWNLGEGRFIPKQHKRRIKVHRSVEMRMEARCPDGDKKYLPRASIQKALDNRMVDWID